ncbi:MAG TPA: xanthine dehydrogenase family protein molybdopterin-binding subunit [Actinomycetota bacterium]|nr:xanthine dehydrogenase family protein molybdopterin-binding subunit [Actinomycetota bacterium]
MTPRNYIGVSPLRSEDDGLVRGAHPYVADLRIPGCLEACFVRSFEAHGELRAVDISESLGLEGVEAAFSAAELPDLPPVPAREPAPAGMQRPSLARDRVRFAGEPVAVVIARDRYTAEDGAERVIQTLDPLDAVVGVDAALSSAAPPLFEGSDNVVSTREYGASVEDVMANAAVVVEGRFYNQRLAPTSIEPRAVLAQWDRDRLTVWASHQAPHRLRGELAAAFGLDLEAVRVRVPKVGGAFGAKSQTFAEYIVVAHVARKLDRPVRWIEDRREALQSATHGRGQSQSLRLAADEGGTLLALEAFIDADVGAYPDTGALVPAMTAWVLSGPYRIERLYARIRCVVTNAAPTASYRGAGRPEAAFAIERLIDKLARRLGSDPVELRQANFVPPSDFPYQSPTGAVYDSGDHAAALRSALELAGYEEAREEQSRRRSNSDGRLLGVGIASYLERSGGRSGTSEHGAVEVMAEGVIVARSGATPQGQGHETAFAQVVATVFDVELDRVQVIQGDTDAVPQGTGTFGSRSMQVGGSALHQAAAEVLEEARRRAGEFLEVAEADLVYADGRFTITGTDRSVAIEALVSPAPLESAVELSPPQAFPFGTHVAIVEIDRATGRVEVVKLVAVDDCGVVVNPAIVAGQTLGSITQGLGQALYEELSYDPGGQPLFSSLLDYSIPTASEMPPVLMGESVTPNPNVELGVKGAGEAGCIGAPPAVVNAIVDALGGFDRGLHMPITPEKVWRALESSDL